MSSKYNNIMFKIYLRIRDTLKICKNPLVDPFIDFRLRNRKEYFEDFLATETRLSYFHKICYGYETLL